MSEAFLLPISEVKACALEYQESIRVLQSFSAVDGGSLPVLRKVVEVPAGAAAKP